MIGIGMRIQAPIIAMITIHLTQVVTITVEDIILANKHFKAVLPINPMLLSTSPESEVGQKVGLEAK